MVGSRKSNRKWKKKYIFLRYGKYNSYGAVKNIVPRARESASVECSKIRLVLSSVYRRRSCPYDRSAVLVRRSYRSHSVRRVCDVRLLLLLLIIFVIARSVLNP